MSTASVSKMLTDKLISRLTRSELKDALSDVGDQITREAQRRAPIRQIFQRGKPGPRQYRHATKSEMRAMNSFAKSMGYKQTRNERGQFGGYSIAKGKGIIRNVNDISRFDALISDRAEGEAMSGPSLGIQIGRFERGVTGDKKLNTVNLEKKKRYGGVQAFTDEGLVEEIPKGQRATMLHRSENLRGATRLGHRVEVPGYRFKNTTVQKLLTSRARYDLARPGRGTYRVGSSLYFGGFLRRSIGAEAVHIEGNVVSVTIVAAAPYAKYVEFGTYKDPAQPFMLPALKGAKGALRAELKRRIESAGFKTK